MSSIPSLSVRPLHDSGIPEGPKRITNSPLTKKTTLDYYSGLPDINIFASAPGFGRAGARCPTNRQWFREAPIVCGCLLFGAPKRLNRSGLLASVRGPIFMAKTPKTNPHLQQVVRELREVSRQADAPIWRDVAERRKRPRNHAADA